MLTKLPDNDRMIRFCSGKIGRILKEFDGFVLVRIGKKKKPLKYTKSLILDQCDLVPEKYSREKKPEPIEEYMNLMFQRNMQNRKNLEYKGTTLSGFNIDDEEIEDLVDRSIPSDDEE